MNYKEFTDVLSKIDEIEIEEWLKLDEDRILKMREILFRGQRVDNGEWVEGSLINNAFYKVKSREDVFYIFTPENCEDAYSFEDFTDDYGYYEVIPETVSQFTGLTDKNGNKIFEGNQVKVGDSIIFEVVFINGAFVFKNSETYILRLDLPKTEEIEIIGNIYQDVNK